MLKNQDAFLILLKMEKSLSIKNIFSFLKVIAWIFLSGYCIKKVLDVKRTYDLKRVTSTQYSKIESEFYYPSLTVCVNMDREITGSSNNMTWWSYDKYRDYTNLPFDLIGTIDERICR